MRFACFGKFTYSLLLAALHLSSRFVPSEAEPMDNVRVFNKAFFSWIPPSWKLTGSKIIESPLGRVVTGSSYSICALGCGRGSSGFPAPVGRSSSPVKLKNSKEKARSR